MFRTFRTTTVILGGVTISALLLTGCSTTDADAQDGPTLAAPSASAAPQVSPTPESVSPEEQAIAEAEPMVHEFYRVEDQAAQDPDSFDRKDFKRVATNVALHDVQQSFQSLKEQGLRQVGGTTIDSIKPSKVVFDQPDQHNGEYDAAIFRVCYNVVGLDLLDKEGKSAVTQERKEHGVVQAVVIRNEKTDAEWRVGELVYMLEESC